MSRIKDLVFSVLITYIVQKWLNIFFKNYWECKWGFSSIYICSEYSTMSFLLLRLHYLPMHYLPIDVIHSLKMVIQMMFQRSARSVCAMQNICIHKNLLVSMMLLIQINLSNDTEYRNIKFCESLSTTLSCHLSTAVAKDRNPNLISNFVSLCLPWSIRHRIYLRSVAI